MARRNTKNFSSSLESRVFLFCQCSAALREWKIFLTNTRRDGKVWNGMKKLFRWIRECVEVWVNNNNKSTNIADQCL